MKNIKNIGYLAFVVFLFGYIFFEDNFTSWKKDRRNRQISNDGLERLVDEYGLKIPDPIESFNQCSYYYELKKAVIELESLDVNLKDKDIFMVNCIPVIREVFNKCDFKDSEITFVWRDETYNLPTKSCTEEVLDPLIIDK